MDDSSIKAFLELPELRAGQVVDAKFRIVRRIGEGSFGRVYEAHDMRVDRRVALKTVFTTGHADHARRLKREIALVRAIEHANVVRLYDSGEDPDGILYMSMELVDGRELGDVLHAEGPFALDRALRVTFQVLDALAEALRHDVVHLDLKPENIILTAEGLRRDVVKLLDFGIAKTYEGTSQFGYAAATVAAGTPLYMAPEQVANQDLGPHTDVYQIALVVLEMLTGQPVFVGSDALEVLTQKSHVHISVPDQLVPTPLGRVLERALDPDHRERPPTVIAFYEELQAALGDGGWGQLAMYPSRRRTQTSGKLPTPSASLPPRSAVDEFFADLESPGDDLASQSVPEPATAPPRPRRHTMQMSDDQLEAISGSQPVVQRYAMPDEPAEGETPRGGLPLVSILKRRKKK